MRANGWARELVGKGPGLGQAFRLTSGRWAGVSWFTLGLERPCQLNRISLACQAGAGEQFRLHPERLLSKCLGGANGKPRPPLVNKETLLSWVVVMKITRFAADCFEILGIGTSLQLVSDD